MDWFGGGSPQDAVTDQNTQGSANWLKWRGKGLGSSDAAVLLGWSPWKDLGQLYDEKLGLSTPVFSGFQLKAMDRGKELEPVIRRWYETKVGHKFPDGIAENPNRSFMRASFDGINHELKKIIEIKAPNKNDHELAIAGMVPEKYRPQVQWLLMVSGYAIADYVSYGSDDTYAIVEVPRDALMQAELEARAIEFWRGVSLKTGATVFPKWVRPMGKLVMPDAGANIDGEPLDKLVSDALAAQVALKSAESAFSVLKERLKAALGDQDEKEAGEAVFGWQTRKGAVDYAKVKELEGVDLEPYRKEAVRAFYFERKKK